MKVRHKKKKTTQNIGKKQIMTTVVILVGSFVSSIFLEPSLIWDMHVVLNHELVRLYEVRLHHTNNGPTKWVCHNCWHVYYSTHRWIHAVLPRLLVVLSFRFNKVWPTHDLFMLKISILAYKDWNCFKTLI